MRASCEEESPISGATTLEEEATSLVLGAIVNGEFSGEDGEKAEKARAFLKKNLSSKTLDAEFSEEERVMTLKKTIVFYRHTYRPRYAARISRPIRTDTWQRTQNASLAFNRAASLQCSQVHNSSIK